MPSRAKEVQLVARPSGELREHDFRIASVEVEHPASGQFLVRNTWMSIDPSARIRMGRGRPGYLAPFALGAPPHGWAVGEVVESRAEGFAVGDRVLHQLGWREYSLLSPDGAGTEPPVLIDVDDQTQERAYLGPLGWVGLTSYVGLVDVAELRPGDVVFVSAAAGAVGSLAVQIAKLGGHRVIASAGSPEKVKFLTERLGADAAFSYREGPIGESLRASAPDGIDVYFDNVGGDHLEAAIAALRPRGRVALCGAVSGYDSGGAAAGPSNLFDAVAKGLTLRGFMARMYADRMPQFRADMRAWLASGRIFYPEQVYEGVDSAPRALIDMLAGRTIGKVILRLS
jgi:NADPH-dependent curcumin reductase CurA